MNVYDFDGTIFVPDSSYCFVLYCMRHYPRAVLKAVPGTLWQFVVYLREGRKDAGKLKESMFSFLNRLDSVESIVQDFWAENFDRIEAWYLAQKRGDDLIISASPDFLLRPAAEKLGVALIATPMNPYTGKIMGKNCHDREKVRRFLEHYDRDSVENFYSDSLSDSLMAELADRAWMVKDHLCFPWPI